jgi:hypothetical protein
LLKKNVAVSGISVTLAAGITWGFQITVQTHSGFVHASWIPDFNSDISNEFSFSRHSGYVSSLHNNPKDRVSSPEHACDGYQIEGSRELLMIWTQYHMRKP